ncbi:hypothetical protein OBP_157 [Pseudomonas phage OBP]|uniref:hypothetical protein n=1 Tax=Pseudomonas phage OBP TaxID=1124849 RepID=UPI000240D572|nr:hypothetical protein OBP_157 [Pseudomonas phage OBP]AEV89594.1 hypothetical protein OBP_157 [Pseudomonas phage OBP]
MGVLRKFDPELDQYFSNDDPKYVIRDLIYESELGKTRVQWTRGLNTVNAPYYDQDGNQVKLIGDDSINISVVGPGSSIMYAQYPSDDLDPSIPTLESVINKAYEYLVLRTVQPQPISESDPDIEWMAGLTVENLLLMIDDLQINISDFSTKNPVIIMGPKWRPVKECGLNHSKEYYAYNKDGSNRYSVRMNVTDGFINYYVSQYKEVTIKHGDWVVGVIYEPTETKIHKVPLAEAHAITTKQIGILFNDDVEQVS